MRDPNCTLCPLHEDAATVCMDGIGPIPCDGMIIGEAPGLTEDTIGMPFVGKSGQLLRETLLEIGLNPDSLYITNTVACRPPANRTPTKSEIKTCSTTYLIPRLDEVKPKAILLLGNSALWFATGRKGGITELEGTTFNQQGVLFPDGVTYVPSRHPSSLLRAQGTDGYRFLLQKFKENLLLFKRVLYPTDGEFEFIKRFPEDLHEGPIHIDIETSGLNPFREDAKIHCMAVAQDPNRVFCFTVHEDGKARNYDRIRDLIKKHPIVAQRGTFEGTWIRKKLGITPRIYFDTKLGSFLIDENEQSGLKYQAIKHLNVDPWDENIDFQNPDFNVMMPYNARDTSYMCRLYNERDRPHLKKHPKQAALLKYILLPAEEVFIGVICRGFHIDMEQAEKKLIECKEKEQEHLDKICEIAGREINPGSPKQMTQLLYGDLGLKCPVKTKKGTPSSSEAALIRLAGQHAVIDPILDWRKWKKFDSTYLTPWITNGPILHASYGFTNTDTGRLNSTMVRNSRHEKKLGATLHQCPRDAFIRNLIHPRHPDWCIVAADWSQIELRLVAHCAVEKTMIEIFQNGGDIHLDTARDVLGRTGDIDKETRKKAKAVNFGFVYGMFPDKFQAYAKEKFGLDISRHEAKRYRDRYFEKYDGLKPWHNRVESQVSQIGFIDSVFGRRRHLPDAMDYELDEWTRRRAIRQGVNSPIQSAGSDLLLLLLSLIASQSIPWDFKINPKRCLTVGSAHDSALFEAQKSYAPELKEGLLWTVDNLGDPLKKWFNLVFRVPLKLDVTAYKTHWEGEILDLPRRIRRSPYTNS